MTHLRAALNCVTKPVPQFLREGYGRIYQFCHFDNYDTNVSEITPVTQQGCLNRNTDTPVSKCHNSEFFAWLSRGNSVKHHCHNSTNSSASYFGRLRHD